MKISCLPVSIFGPLSNGEMSIPEWADHAKKMGYDGIDISILFIKNRTPVYLNKLKQEMKKIDIPIVMMTTYPDFTHPDPTQRIREFDYLIHDIALCSELEIKYLRIIAGQAHPEMAIDLGVDLVIKNFRDIVPYAEKYGVGLVYEDHAKPGAWDYVDFSFPPDIFMRIYEGIKDTSIRINFDTGNIVAYGQDPLPLLKEIYDKVETIHITDMKESGKFSPVMIGTGVVPNKEALRFLKEKGFDGWISIEEASGNGLKGIQTAIDFVKDAWGKA
jgi:sugar phosphate isomerase/epimerase